jgi:hypothetical protein
MIDPQRLDTPIEKVDMTPIDYDNLKREVRGPNRVLKDPHRQLNISRNI